MDFVLVWEEVSSDSPPFLRPKLKDWWCTCSIRVCWNLGIIATRLSSAKYEDSNNWSQGIGSLLNWVTFSVNNAGIALPPVKGLCYCLSLSTKALIHNWLPGPGDLEKSTNYGVDCSKIPPPSKDGESPSNLIPFHSIQTPCPPPKHIKTLHKKLT